MARKVLMEVSPENIPHFVKPCTICLLIKATKIPIGPTIDVSKFPSRFMHHMDFVFFSVEIIRGFTSTLLAIYSYTLYPFFLDPIPIKYLPEVKKVLRSLISTSIKGGNCSYEWKNYSSHFANGSSQIKSIYFYQ